MPKMYIDRSILIDAPTNKIYSIITNFNDWRPWSPWLIIEPETKLTVAQDGQSYEWEGVRTGSGNMTIRKAEDNKKLELDLNFLKPWKSYANTWFTLEDEGGSTRVHWAMESSIPFFLFFMVRMMKAMIENDYDKGLMMLKSYVETGAVPSKLNFVGTSQFPGGKYVGVNTLCDMASVGPFMERDFEKLMEAMSDHKKKIKGKSFSIYHKWDFVRKTVKYTSAIQVSEFPEKLGEEFVMGELPATSVNTVRHTGPYQYLGNAWSAQYSMKQAKEIRLNTKIDPFEVYMNVPGEVSDEELVTEVHFPIK